MSRPQPFGCFSQIWHACKCHRPKEPNNTQEYSDLIVNLRGDNRDNDNQSPDTNSQHLFCGNLEVLSYTRLPGRSILSPSVKSDTSSKYSSQINSSSHHYNSSQYYYTTTVPSTVDSESSRIVEGFITQRGPLNDQAVAEELTQEQSKSHQTDEDNSPSRQFVIDKKAPFLTIPKPMEHADESNVESKEVVKSQHSKGSLEKIPGMIAMGPSKFTIQTLEKEQRNLKLNEKKIVAQVDKLRKSRNSIDQPMPEKKREKLIKEMGKNAEQVAVLEIERDATKMKINRLQEVMSERGSLFSVVRRNTESGSNMGSVNVVN